MGKIKFRAYDKELKAIFPVVWINWTISEVALVRESDQFVWTRPFTEIEFMQFTGLHDKNGKEIWEGNILKRRDGAIYTVEYEAPWFVCRGVGEKSWRHEDFSDGYESKNEQPEIIGNIYENPELIK